MHRTKKNYTFIWRIAGLFVVVAAVVSGYFLLKPSIKESSEATSTKSSSQVESSTSSSTVEESSTTTTSSVPQTTASSSVAVPVEVAPATNVELTNYLNSLAGEPVGVFVQRLDQEINYGVNSDKIFYGASVAKLPIIFYTVSQLQAGAISWQTSFPYTDAVNEVTGAMVSGGTGSLQYEAYAGRKFSVEDLLGRAIMESDNQASNMLSYYVGGSNGANFLAAIQPYYTFSQAQFSKNMNATTAASLMRAIYQNGLANTYFAQTDWQSAKIGSLPYTVLHKIGINGAFNHDVGVVVAPQPYVLAILTNGYSDGQIAAIAERINDLIE